MPGVTCHRAMTAMRTVHKEVADNQNGDECPGPDRLQGDAEDENGNYCGDQPSKKQPGPIR
jgi:hypothetical protein